MSVPTILLICIGLALYICLARMIAGHIAHYLARGYSRQKGRPDTDDWGPAIVMGLVWPLTVIGRLAFILIRALIAAAPRVGAERTYLKSTERERMQHMIVEAEKRAGLN